MACAATQRRNAGKAGTATCVVCAASWAGYVVVSRVVSLHEPVVARAGARRP